VTATATPTAVWLPAKPGLEPAAAWELASEQIDALADIVPELSVAPSPRTYDEAEAEALAWAELPDTTPAKWLVVPVHRPREVLGTKDRTFTVNVDHTDDIDPGALAAAELDKLGPDERIETVTVLEDKIRNKTDAAATPGKTLTVYTVQRAIEPDPDAEDQTVRYEPVLDDDGKPCQDVAQAKARTLAVELSNGPELGNLLVVTAEVTREGGTAALVEVRTTFASRKVKLKATIAKLGPGTDGTVGWMVGLLAQ
jgi:hypothetical protein